MGSVLTLDIDGDTGLLAIGNGLICGTTDDLLSGLDVGGRDVQCADGALSPPISEKCLRREREREREREKG